MPLSLDQQMEAVSRRFEELAHRLNQPETAADPAAFRRLMQEYHEAEPAVTAYRALRTERDHLAQAKALLAGDEALEPDFGFEFSSKPDAEHTCIRLVTSWATPEANVDAFLAALKALS